MRRVKERSRKLGSFKETRVLYCESNDKDIPKPSVRLKVNTNEIVSEGWTVEKMTSTDLRSL